MLIASSFTATSQTENLISAQATLVRSMPIGTPSTNRPLYAAYAFYSDINTFSGSAFSNGGATLTAGNTITRMVADDITLAGTPPYAVDGFTFSVANLNATIVSARPRVRFYYADGTGGAPGTYITGYSFNAISFAATTVGLYTATGLTFPSVTSSNIWAAITFDNNTGATGATLAQLNNLGQGLYTPPDIGTSTDELFRTTAAGSFLVNNPAGTITASPFAGAPVANFGWEITPVAPVPVVIAYIHGTRTGNIHNLTWQVNCATSPRAKMTIERSANRISYSAIYNITADAVRCQQSFTYADAQPLSGINYYRLKLEGADGQVSYSTVIAILNKSQGFEIVSLSPNPVTFSGSAVLNVTSAEKGKMQIIVTDAVGKRIMSQSAELAEGSTQVQLNFSRLARGTYQINVTTDNGTSKTVQFVK